jgi:hypothetical protein
VGKLDAGAEQASVGERRISHVVSPGPRGYGLHVDGATHKHKIGSRVATGKSLLPINGIGIIDDRLTD